jgi:hypothetical protein
VNDELPIEPIEEISEPVRDTISSLVFNALGYGYAFLLPTAALISFAAVLILIRRGKGPELSGALLLIVPLPVLVGVFGTVHRLFQFNVLISNADTYPKPSEYAYVTAMCLVPLALGLLFALPSYLFAAIGLTMRAIGRRRSLMDPATTNA